ncbi:MAG: hypothetical protein NTX61_01615 [Bacteroidetes bacterium]|nr:hypothetical protein [Bacteroidota bacterium]
MKNSMLSTLAVLLLFPAIQGNSQDTCRRIAGISATIQTTQFGIMVPIWIGNDVSIAPAFNFQWGETLGTDYSIGIVPKFYFSTKKVSPYLSLRGGFATFIPDDKNDTEIRTTDYVAGIAFGAEYFFDPAFSFGVEIQGNFTKSDKNSMRFNNPGNWNFNLATMVSANIYFLKYKK